MNQLQLIQQLTKILINRPKQLKSVYRIALENDEIIKFVPVINKNISPMLLHKLTYPACHIINNFTCEELTELISLLNEHDNDLFNKIIIILNQVAQYSSNQIDNPITLILKTSTKTAIKHTLDKKYVNDYIKVNKISVDNNVYIHGLKGCELYGMLGDLEDYQALINKRIEVIDLIVKPPQMCSNINPVTILVNEPNICTGHFTIQIPLDECIVNELEEINRDDPFGNRIELGLNLSKLSLNMLDILIHDLTVNRLDKLKIEIDEILNNNKFNTNLSCRLTTVVGALSNQSGLKLGKVRFLLTEEISNLVKTIHTKRILNLDILNEDQLFKFTKVLKYNINEKENCIKNELISEIYNILNTEDFLKHEGPYVYLIILLDSKSVHKRIKYSGKLDTQITMCLDSNNELDVYKLPTEIIELLLNDLKETSKTIDHNKKRKIIDQIYKLLLTNDLNNLPNKVCELKINDTIIYVNSGNINSLSEKYSKNSNKLELNIDMLNLTELETIISMMKSSVVPKIEPITILSDREYRLSLVTDNSRIARITNDLLNYLGPDISIDYHTINLELLSDANLTALVSIIEPSIPERVVMLDSIKAYKNDLNKLIKGELHPFTIMSDIQLYQIYKAINKL